MTRPRKRLTARKWAEVRARALCETELLLTSSLTTDELNRLEGWIAADILAAERAAIARERARRGRGR